MSLIFIEKFGRKIKLSNERIKHIRKHIQSTDKLHIIENILKNPDIITQNQFEKTIYNYPRYLKDENLYFIIVIKTFNGEGFMLTAYKSKKPKQ